MKNADRFAVLIFLITLLTFIFSSCQRNVAILQSQPIETSGWEYEDILKFPFEIGDTSSFHNLIARLNHQDDFQFQNLYVKIYTLQPKGDTTSQVTSFDLADNTGLWHGKCRRGNCIVQIMLQENFRFKVQGSYEIWIEQYMRSSPVEGIKQVSLIVEKTRD